MKAYGKLIAVTCGLLLAGRVFGPACAEDKCDAQGRGAAPACGAGPNCGVAGCTDPSACHHCRHCGGADGCLTCRLVPEDKKLKVTCFAAECKPLCLPCPSHKGCRNVDCADCSKEGVSSSQKKVVWFDWCATSAKVHTPKHLMRKTTEKKVPSFKWVVENLCDKCQAECQEQTVPAPADAPPPPKVGAKILYGVPLASHTTASPA
jgi:hypothetical protein